MDRQKHDASDKKQSFKFLKDVARPKHLIYSKFVGLRCPDCRGIVFLTLFFLGGCACRCDQDMCLAARANDRAIGAFEEVLQMGGTSDSETAGPLASVHFDYKKETPLEADMRRLDRNLEFLQKNPNIKVSIEGHCDAVGGLAYNERLGRRRAAYVYHFLKENGIAEERLRLVSMSSRVPLSDSGDDSALKMQKDRRVNFVIDAL
jgi:outer membrane protein OmpA-like peptidoglycan-associated protein